MDSTTELHPIWPINASNFEQSSFHRVRGSTGNYKKCGTLSKENSFFNYSSQYQYSLVYQMVSKDERGVFLCSCDSFS